MHLDFEDQLLLFKQRNMGGIDKNSDDFKRQVNSVKTIGYYNLKQYAYMFYNKNSKKYNGINFNDLITKYWRDQKLKEVVFQAISDIEVALETQLAYVLGEKGGFEYIDFKKWAQYTGYNANFDKSNKNFKKKQSNKNKVNPPNTDLFTIKKDEVEFLKKINRRIHDSNIIDIKDFLKEDRQKPRDERKIFPPVWLMVNTLTFGEATYILKLMNPGNRRRVSDYFGLEPSELIGDLETLKLIRNMCCHNFDLSDIILVTLPSVRNKYYQYLKLYNNQEPPKRIATVICVMLELMKVVNPKYKFDRLKGRLKSICKVNCNRNKDYIARGMGFKDYKSITDLVDSFEVKKNVRVYPSGKEIFC